MLSDSPVNALDTKLCPLRIGGGGGGCDESMRLEDVGGGGLDRLGGSEFSGAELCMRDGGGGGASRVPFRGAGGIWGA